jgi:hypothetical protein
MDRNPNHFPTLLIVCMLMSILLYVASTVVYFLHERKNSLNARASITNGAALSPDIFNEEEQQMTEYLRDQENK